MNIKEFFGTVFNPPYREGKQHKTNPRANSHWVSPEITIYRRERSAVWQCRFKLKDGRWHRLSTGCLDLDQARQSAIRLSEHSAVREDLGFPVKQSGFTVVANITVQELRTALSAGHGKVVFKDYIAVIERYLIPFFGRMTFERITPEVLTDFETWRETQLRKKPRASTMRTHASAFNRVIDAAKRRGLLPTNKSIPSLNAQGRRGEPRPNFSEREIEHLLAFLPQWSLAGRLSLERDIRPLLRDYVEFLLYTGVRHGTEARRLEWRHLQWHWDGNKRYLRIWVSGKTGPRYLISKAGAVKALDRLAHRNKAATLEALIDSRLSERVFVSASGYEPHGFEGSFRKLMRDSGLLKDSSGKNRTLYSLRHTYATFALRDGISIHTIARQMGTSVLMLERHYSKLTPMMNAAELGE